MRERECKLGAQTDFHSGACTFSYLNTDTSKVCYPWTVKQRPRISIEKMTQHFSSAEKKLIWMEGSKQTDNSFVFLQNLLALIIEQVLKNVFAAAVRLEIPNLPSDHLVAGGGRSEEEKPGG